MLDETLDAFTLDRAYRDVASSRCNRESGSSCWSGEKVNHFIPNPTFDPIIVPGCIEPLFRGQIPEGFDPASLMQVEPLRGEYQHRDLRVKVMDEQGIGAALLFPTLGCGVEQGPRHDVEATMATLSAFNRWLEEDWGFNYEGRILAAPMLSLADPEVAVKRARLAHQSRARIVLIRPAPVPGPDGTGRSLGDKLHDPVWARLADASIPVRAVCV